jgi:protein disulfide-isomerase A6
VAELDATVHTKVASRFGIRGYPTIKLFPATPSGRSKLDINYDGERTEMAMISFLNDHCKTDRRPGGKLGEKAGRIESMDPLLVEFMKANDKEVVLEKVKEMANTNPSKPADYYVKVLGKLSKDMDYANKELDRLTKVLTSDKMMTEDKLDHFIIRQNILRHITDVMVANQPEGQHDEL